MLVATPGFAALPGGITPDYTLPDPAVFGAFFNPAATIITINYSGLDSRDDFPAPFLPRNGVSSIIDANPTGSPTSCHRNEFADPFHARYVLFRVRSTFSLRATTTETASWMRATMSCGARRGPKASMPAKARTATSMARSTTPDYTHWRARFGNSGVVVAGGGSGSGTSANAAVPEPVASVLLLLMTAGICLWRRRAALPVSTLVRE